MKNEVMLSVISSVFRDYLVWLIAAVIVAVGLRHAREVVAFVLDKLYQTFIQNNPPA